MKLACHRVGMIRVGDDYRIGRRLKCGYTVNRCTEHGPIIDEG
jgi:hypothetical protein